MTRRLLLSGLFILSGIIALVAIRWFFDSVYGQAGDEPVRFWILLAHFYINVAVALAAAFLLKIKLFGRPA